MTAYVAPDTDLRAYAEARGLSHRGNASQVGWLAAFGMSEELQFNVLRGVLPGGEHGIVFHDVHVLEGEQGYGMQYATQFGGTKQRAIRVRDFIPFAAELLDRTGLFKLPQTTAAIRLPEASGLVVGLAAGRPAERNAPTLGQWREVAGAPRGWTVGARERGDALVVEEIVNGPLSELLAATQPLGFSVTLRFGTLVVSQLHFADDDATLDALCEKASALARAIRAVCERHTQPLGFDVELPEPDWLAAVRARGGSGISQGGDGQDLGAVVAFADQAGMQLEDAFAFMRAFADVPFPGEAFGVLRGTLPGAGVPGRVVVALEREAKESPAVQKALVHRIGGPFGCDTVLFAVGAGVPDTPGTEGEQWVERTRIAVRRGIAAAWRARERASPQLYEVEALAADAVRALRDRGALC